MDNRGLIIVSLILASSMFISIDTFVFASNQPKILQCYPESEDRNTPTVFEPSEEYEIYAYVQEAEGVNISQIKIEILALESVPYKMSLVSSWNVTWYQITTEFDSAGVERPNLDKVIAETTWTELNWKYDWGDGEIIGNHTDMVAFVAVGKVEVAFEGGVAIEITSDDGMLVYLDGTALRPDIWFAHGAMSVESQVWLHTGIHDLTVLWFDKGGKALSEFKMYPVEWSVEETIQLSKGEVGLDSEGRPYTKYNATWTPNLLLGQSFLFEWILEDEEKVFDNRTTYVHIYLPMDGYFTINGEIVQTSTFEVSKPFVEFWFYSKSRGDEVSSVIVEVSDSDGLLPNPTGRILLNEIERDRVWYGKYTLPRYGEFGVKGSFQSVRGEEWVKMSAVLLNKSELSPLQIRFLINGGTIVLVLVIGYSVFYLIRKLDLDWLDKERF